MNNHVFDHNLKTQFTIKILFDNCYRTTYHT